MTKLPAQNDQPSGVLVSGILPDVKDGFQPPGPGFLPPGWKPRLYGSQDGRPTGAASTYLLYEPNGVRAQPHIGLVYLLIGKANVCVSRHALMGVSAPRVSEGAEKK